MVSPAAEPPLSFLCHSSGDKARVRELYWQLKRDGYRCWFDEEDLLPGQDWELEINLALRRSDYVIVCLSQTSVSKRGFVQRELKTALDIADELPEGEIFLIPVRLEPCQPPDRLRSRHWVDLFTTTGYRQLTRALQPRGISNATTPASAWDRIVPPELERQQSVPWEKYRYDNPTIFISYQPEGAALVATRLYDRLAARFGRTNVFIDVSSVGFGIDAHEATVRAVDQSEVMIILIDDSWRTPGFLDSGFSYPPSDPVRIEIETAIDQGKQLLPVLVGDAQMPDEDLLPRSIAVLTRLQKARLSLANLEGDIALLMETLQTRYRFSGKQ